ncbi:MAG: hypothetical protein D3903_03440, partial [Candidatus Electrothrix sp. GM3_4]|nr:hypothetical protein [Candidatus Electrothrix sp. GM3_4]
LGWDTWTPSGGYGAFPYPGETVRTQGVWYDLGNVGAGFDNDNDGVPDKNAWMQPVGDPSLYDAGCFRLVRTYGIVIVKQQGGTEHLIPFADQLYFENIPDNTGAIGLVFYEYAALNGVCRGALSPYQEVASGYDNEKFSGDYGTAIQMETREPLAFIAKNVFDDSLNPDPVLSGSAQTLVYQIEVTNPNTYTSGGQGLIVPLGDPLQGTPIVTRDSIPSGTEYIAGSALFISNGTTTKSGKILFSTDNGRSWSTIEPSPANTVTDIEWWLDESLTSDDATGENTMKVEFRVSVPGTYSDPYVTNIGCAAFGTGPCFDEDDAVTLVNGTNQIIGDLWEDTGSGNDYGDGEKDAGEAGVSGSVDIAVYYDTDDSGDYSEGDILWETVTTDGTGHYQTSTTLPDGKWVLVVGSLPSPTYDGWANTTDVVHVVDGLTGGETRQAPDTGYAPALILDKDVHNPADDSRIDDEDAGFTPPIDINEGDTVKYTIDVTNTLYDPGSGPTCTQDLWATTEDVSYGNGWTNPGESYDSPPRNGNGAIAPFASNTDNLGLTTFALVPEQIGTITAIDIVVPLIKSTVFTGDGDNERIYFEIYDETDNLVIDGAGNPKYEFGPYDQPVVDGSCTVPCSGDFVITDILSDLLGTPTLADLANYDIVLVAKKGGPTPGGVLKVDSGAFQVTTDQSCGSTPRDSTIINPVPLEDTFDADELEFVSASPSPDRLTLIDPGNNIYRIEWDNLADSLGDLGPGDTHSITVNFKALQPSTSPPAVQSPVTNTANIDSAKFKTGTPSNTTTDSVDVDLYHTAVIGDFIWNDENGDGLQAGETGLAGVDVFLCNSPVAGLPCDPADPEYVTTATTDASGFYQFTGVTDGAYVLAVDTTDLPGTNFNTTPTGDPDATKDSQATLTITNSGDNLDQDWGYQSTKGTISGDVWDDKNGDAVQDAVDAGFTGWTVELRRVSDSSLVDTQITATGAYSFEDLDPDSYYVQVTPAVDYNQTFDYDESGVCTVCNDQSDISSPLVIATNENLINVNFAYQTTGTNSIGNTLYVDLTGNAAWDQGGASTSAEPVIPNITVNLYEDNGTIGVLDAADILRATDVTDGNGTYGFTSLPDGDYLVVVDENDSDFPQLTQTSDPDEDSQATDLDSDTTVCTICDGQAVVNVTGGTNNTTTDFGYQPNGGMLGDSIYWDANGDGSQGQFEPGITGVEVKLYTFTDTDGDGRWDIGEPRVDTGKTATTDMYGKYLFYGLPDDNYAVEVTSGAGTPIGIAELTADPGVDGAVCPAAGSMCDEVHGVKIEGNNYMGADFGYQPPGVIGDQLFIDRDRSGGPMDGNDAPIAYVTVNLQDCGPNGTCGDGDDGPNQTTQTDDAGQYSFINLDIGSTFVITVDTTGPDFPVDLLGPATYNGTSDTDGFVNNTSTVIATTEPIRNIDFGYPLEDANDLSGTVCLETAANGVCGSGDSGVDGDETAYSGTSVYVSKWTDANSDNIIDAGELIFLSQTDTDANGDYLFDGLPSVNGVNESYLVSLSAPEDYLDLTTVAANTPADLLTENNESGTGYTTTAWQRVSALDDSNLVGFDFAFEEAADFDYGDLPSSYPTLKDDNGARHVVPVTPNLYLGATPPDTELDAVPDAAAQGDGADEDGISATPATWTEGLVTDGNGGSVQVTVTDDITAGTGWLVAWIDFDGDGSFSTYGEMIISQKVSSGTQSYSFDIPTGTFDASQGYARFRLFPEKPVIPELAYKGTAENGEVEDVQFDFGTGTIGDRVWLDENGDGVQDAGEAGISGVTVYIDDDGTLGYSAGDTQSVTDSNGNYLLKDVAPGTHTVLVKSDTLPAGLAANPTYDEDGTGTVHQTDVDLSTGESHTTADFSYNWTSTDDTGNPDAADTGAIGDRIWNDADGDGIQDPNEAGVVGITVNLLTDDNNDGVYGGAGDDPAVTTITGSDGRYIFDNLAPGSYVVEVDSTTLDTAGYNTIPTGDPDNPPDPNDRDGKTTSPVVLAPGDVFVNADFGYTVNGGGSSIGDLIYLDTDASGTYSAVDTGIAGVSVVLEDASGNIIGTAITDENGAYRFNGLPDGDYIVKVLDSSNLLNGLSPTADPDGGADSESALNLSGSDNLDQDFGYAPEGHSNTEGLIGDTIFLDTGNGSGGAPDGDYDAGEGIQGVTVRLYDGVGSLVAMTVTDVNGQYRFGNLDENATYEVRVDTDTLPNGGIGLTNSVDPDNDGTVNRSTVNLSTETDGTAGDGIVLDQDFGYTATIPNTIFGTIWDDSDANGTLTDGSGGTPDETGKGLAGVTVILRDDSGNIVATAVTDGSGNYSFSNLPDDTYKVDIIDTTGVLDGYWHSVGPNAGDGVTDNNSQAAPYTVTVSGGEVDTTGDFGYYKASASVGNLVWNDLDGNGINDVGELPMVHYQVKLTITYPNGAETTMTTMTDIDGLYSFDNIMLDEDYNAAGGGLSYTITVPSTGDLVSSHTITSDNFNAADGVPAANDQADNPDGELVTGLVKGEIDSTRDFGFVGGATIGDRIWLDLDRNGAGEGMQNLGDPGLSGITVELYRDDGNTTFGAEDGPAILTTVTDGNGNYSFEGIPPGDYWVDVDETTLPTGLVAVTADLGGDDTLDSDLDADAGGATVVTVTSGEVVDRQDFGYVGTSPLLGDTLWYDSNGNGIQDLGEPGLKGVDVVIHPCGLDGICGTADDNFGPDGLSGGGDDIADMTATTDAAGNYLQPVVPSTYSVTVTTGTLPAGLNVIPTNGTSSREYTVPADADVLHADFGFELDGGTEYTIGNLIWEDNNGDGVKDAGETNGIGGVTVDLYRDGIPIATTTTAADGSYVFTVVETGADADYEVHVTDRDNILDGRTLTSGTTNTDNNSQLDPFIINDLAGDINYADFGYQSLNIGDRIWHDLNDNGIQDAGESGLNGVEVLLYLE